MIVEIYETNLAARAVSTQVAPVLATFAALTSERQGLPEAGALVGALADHSAQLAELEPCSDADFRYLASGSAIAAACGFDLAGRRTSEEGPAGPHLAAAYRRALDEGRPLLVIHRASAGRNRSVWERLVLPCRSHDGGERVLTFVNSRELGADVLEAMVEASCHGVLALRPIRDGQAGLVDAVVLAANRLAGEYVGQPAPELLDRSVLDLVPALARNGGWARCMRVIQEKTTERFEVQYEAEGLDTWLGATAVPLGEGLMISLTDVTDFKYALFEMEVLKEEAERAREDLSAEIEARAMLEAELRRMALTDALTGVLNRRGFDELARHLTASAKRDGHRLAVIAIDLDHFKRVNDLHGHSAGDAVLAAVANLLMNEVRGDTDVVSRVGGEEFMVLLPHTSAEGAALLADRLRWRVMEMSVLAGETAINVTASFGVRELPASADAERMLIEADAALYEAKQSGRNCVVIWDDARAAMAAAGARSAA